MRLGDLDFNDSFYFEGTKYTQMMRPKKPLQEPFGIYCSSRADKDWIKFLSDCEVKRIVRIN